MYSEYTEGWDDNFAASTSADENNDDFNDENDNNVESINVDEIDEYNQYNDNNINVNRSNEAWGEAINDNLHNADVVHDKTNEGHVFSQEVMQEDNHEELLEEKEELQEWQQSQSEQEEELYLSQEQHAHINKNEDWMQKPIGNALPNRPEVMTKPFSQTLAAAEDTNQIAKPEVSTTPVPNVLLQQEPTAKDRVEKPLTKDEELEQVQQLLNCFKMALPTNVFDEQLRKVLHESVKVAHLL